MLDDAGIDAAAIELTDEGRALMNASHGGPPLASSLADPSVWSQPTVAFRPTARDYSRPTVTTDGPMDAYLDAEARGNYWVRGVVGTEGTITDVGDSGTALCAGDDNQYALGICVGAFQNHSVAEPIGRVLQNLQTTLGAVSLVPTQQG
ncbi:MAG TPA: hypothetical protein VK989_04070 [Polyangia bacterium]|nr:hypothetical protein [Polyangia bacterium]